MGKLLCSDVGWDGGATKILPYISDFGKSLLLATQLLNHTGRSAQPSSRLMKNPV
jgi:hypothetical protein